LFRNAIRSTPKKFPGPEIKILRHRRAPILRGAFNKNDGVPSYVTLQGISCIEYCCAATRFTLAKPCHYQLDGARFRWCSCCKVVVVAFATLDVSGYNTQEAIERTNETVGRKSE
jgi:hypothetical protein